MGAAVAAVVAASAGTDVLHHMALADLGSGFLAAGETAVLSLFAAYVPFGQAAVLGVQVLTGTALLAAAVVVVVVNGIHAGHWVVLAELGKPQAVALLGNPVAGNAPDRTAEIASDAYLRYELDKAGGVVGPGHVVSGIHAGVLGCAVLSSVVAVFVDVEAEKLASDYFVVHTVDNLAVAVAAVVVTVHGKETAAAGGAAVVSVSGDLEPADFPKTNYQKS